MRSSTRQTVLLGLLALALLPLAAGAGGRSGEDPPERPGGRGAPGSGGPGPAGAAGEDGDPAPPAHLPQPLAVLLAGRHLGPDYASDHIVVRFADDLAGWQRRQIAAAAGGATYKSATNGAFAKIGVGGGDSAEALAGRLRVLGGVRSAELDPIACGLGRAARAQDGAPGGAQTGAKASFTDPLFPRQWPYQRIRLPEALDLNSRQGEGVIVAVLDSGVAFGDGASFPARRGLDLEGTRFLSGPDLVDGGPPYDEGTGDPGGFRFGHGTFIASQIAATVDNGVAGGSIAPRVTILPVRVLGTDNFGLFSDVAEGVDLAVAAGARVINLSLGGNQPAGFLEQAIERAHRAGVVVVAAAGNNADEPGFTGDVLYPARYETVIAVGATGFDDRRAAYSDFGPGLDLMAPAGGDVARFPLPDLRDAALAPSFVHDPRTGDTLYASFWATGTSFAAPQVSAAAALLIGLGVRDPEAIRQLLLATARDLDAPGIDGATAHGLLDLLAAHRGLGFDF